MISIIISTYQPNYLDALTNNIEATIGNIPYELIPIHNPGKMGICEAYNTGAAQAKYPYLCFMHEDVLFETPSWGERVVAHLKDSETGAIGVAGAAYKCKVPLSWSVVKRYRATNLIQHYGSTKQKETTHVNPGDSETYRVVALDGVFIGTRKEVWEAIKFDAHTFKGFHGYDIDFSLAVAQHYKLFVVFDLLIEHFSQGNPNQDWLAAAVKISEKWKRHLPAHCLDLEDDAIAEIEQHCKKRFRKKLKRYPMGWLQRKLLLLRHG